MKIWSSKSNRYYEVAHPGERFIKYFEKTDGCWLWTGGCDYSGYGIFTIKHGKSVHASKYSWIHHRGKVPKGMYVLHKCDNPQCVNPDHLYVGTPKQNSQDRDRRGRQCVGTSHPLSKLTEDQIREIRAAYTPVRGSIKTLSEKYKVHGTLIKRIIDRRVWKHI